MKRGSDWVVGGLLFAAVLILGCTIAAAAATGAELTGIPNGPATEYLVDLQYNSFVPEPGITVPESDSKGVLDNDRRHVLVQLWKVPTDAVKARMKDGGITLLSYVPDRAWFASVPVSLVDLAAYPEVRWMGPIENEAKLSWRIREEAFDSFAVNDDGTVNALVRLFDDVPMKEAATYLSEQGAEVLDGVRSTHSLLVRARSEELASLASLDIVQWVDQVSPPWQELNDSVRQSTRVETVWQAPYGLSGSGVHVFVFDGDVVYGAHPDFGGRVTEGEPGGGTYDRQHPTHVAGTIGGSGSVNPAYKGMAPSVTFYSLEFDWTDPIFYNNPADTEESYQNAIGQGCDVANNSIGSNVAFNGYNCSWEGDYESSAELIDGIVGGSLGSTISIVWAAGNERTGWWCPGDYNMIPPPSVAKNPIVVGAINSDDDTMTDFSSWGPTDDGRMRPDVVAPGCQNGGDGGVTSTVPTNGYTDMCGTSMAAPTTTGAVALLIEQWRSLNPEKGDPLPSTMKAVLAQTALDLGNTGPDYVYGFGKIDVPDAADVLLAGEIVEDQIEQEQIHLYPVEVTDQTLLKVTLAWDDAPGTPNVNPNLVNNLDLLAESPGGDTFNVWLLNPASPTAPAGFGADARNNLEQLYIADPEPGLWMIKVWGGVVPQGPQAYSLAGGGVGLLSCDADEDTYLAELCGGDDCNDEDADVNPGAEEIPYNGVDDDCNEATRDDDLDEDGYPIATDCNDEDPLIHPDAEEVCGDEVDNNCDGQVDEGCDEDGDDDDDDDGCGCAMVW